MKKTIAAAVIENKKIFLVEKGIGWILPGGKPEGEESDRVCLYREFREELPEANLFLKEFYGSFKGKSTNKQVPIEALVYFADINGDTSKTANEVSSSKWVDYKELKDYYVSELTMKILESLKKDNYL